MMILAQRAASRLPPALHDRLDSRNDAVCVTIAPRLARHLRVMAAVWEPWASLLAGEFVGLGDFTVSTPGENFCCSKVGSLAIPSAGRSPISPDSTAWTSSGTPVRRHYLSPVDRACTHIEHLSAAWVGWLEWHRHLEMPNDAPAWLGQLRSCRAGFPDRWRR